MPQLRLNKRNIYLRYTIAFAVFCLCVLFPFILFGKSFLWSSDGMAQHYPTLLYSRTWIQEVFSNLFSGTTGSKIPNWNLQLGYGQDVIGNVINFRPFNFLWVLFPRCSVDLYLVLRTVISLYLCGIAFIKFIKSKVEDHTSILFATMTYVFSGFSLFFLARHTFFLEMMFYLPLLFVGVETIFRKKFSLMFILMIYFSSLSYFYFLYMVTLPTVVYAAFYYFEAVEKEKRSVLHFLSIVGIFAVQFLIGILAAAFALLPTVFRILDSSRGGGVESDSVLHWNMNVYENLIKGMVDTNQFGIYGHVAMSGLAVFLIAYATSASKKSKSMRNDLWQLLIYALTLSIPLLTMVFNGLGGKTFRWCFVFSFWVSVVVAKHFKCIFKPNVRSLIRASIITASYALLYILVVEFRHGKVGTGLGFVLFYLTAVLAFAYCYSMKKDQEVAARMRKRFSVFMMAILCLELSIKSFEMYSPYGQGYISSYADYGKIEEAGRDNPTMALDMVQDDSIYRVDANVAEVVSKYLECNYGLRNNVNGISSYYGFSDKSICNYSLELGNSTQNIPFLMLGFAQRTILNELASVKYYATFEGEDPKVPYGYSLVGSRERTLSDGTLVTESLYQNDYALPLMYVYDSVIPKQDYDKLPVNQKEQALLQAAVTDADLGFPTKKVVSSDTNLYTNQEFRDLLTALAEENPALELKDDGLLVKKAGSTVVVPLAKGLSGELYVLFSDLEFESLNMYELNEQEFTNRYEEVKNAMAASAWTPDDSATVSASFGTRSDVVSLYNKTYQYAFGKREAALNLGMVDVPQKITLRFSKTGMYRFSDMQIVVRDMERYESDVKKLLSAEITDICVETDVIKGTISSDQDKIVCISVPYAKGWTAYVNNVQVPVYAGSGLNMLIPVKAGVNEIRLAYSTPGFRLGSIISFVTTVLFVAGYIFVIILRRQMRKKNKEKDPDDEETQSKKKDVDKSKERTKKDQPSEPERPKENPYPGIKRV
ncbi:MAG: YfhO family protein [Clostridiales bacterium]|nr:YfhO family protein [Clostridiales bacterium]